MLPQLLMTACVCSVSPCRRRCHISLENMLAPHPCAHLLTPCLHSTDFPPLPPTSPPFPVFAAPRRPGVCFRMFSRHQWSTMPSHTSPEMLRSPLEQVALLIKGMLHQGEREQAEERQGQNSVVALKHWAAGR